MAARVAKADKEPHDQLHAMDYLVYAHLQLGQDAKASAVIDEMKTVTGFNEGFIADRSRSLPRRRATRSSAATGRPRQHSR